MRIFKTDQTRNYDMPEVVTMDSKYETLHKKETMRRSQTKSDSRVDGNSSYFF